jgi:hypothetical protein
MVRDAKGGKDRVTVLPSSILDPLRDALHACLGQGRDGGKKPVGPINMRKASLCGTSSPCGIPTLCGIPAISRFPRCRYTVGRLEFSPLD